MASKQKNWLLSESYDCPENCAFSIAFSANDFTLDLEAASPEKRNWYIEALTDLRSSVHSSYVTQTCCKVCFTEADVVRGYLKPATFPFAPDQNITPTTSTTTTTTTTITISQENKDPFDTHSEFSISALNIHVNAKPIACAFVGSTTYQSRRSKKGHDPKKWFYIGQTEWMHWPLIGSKLKWDFTCRLKVPSQYIDNPDAYQLKICLHDLQMFPPVQLRNIDKFSNTEDSFTLQGYCVLPLKKVLASAFRPRVMLDFTNHLSANKDVYAYCVETQQDVERRIANRKARVEEEERIKKLTIAKEEAKRVEMQRKIEYRRQRDATRKVQPRVQPRKKKKSKSKKDPLAHLKAKIEKVLAIPENDQELQPDYLDQVKYCLDQAKEHELYRECATLKDARDDYIQRMADKQKLDESESESSSTQEDEDDDFAVPEPVVIKSDPLPSRTLEEVKIPILEIEMGPTSTPSPFRKLSNRSPSSNGSKNITPHSRNNSKTLALPSESGFRSRLSNAFGRKKSQTKRKKSSKK